MIFSSLQILLSPFNIWGVLPVCLNPWAPQCCTRRNSPSCSVPASLKHNWITQNNCSCLYLEVCFGLAERFVNSVSCPLFSIYFNRCNHRSDRGRNRLFLDCGVVLKALILHRAPKSYWNRKDRPKTTSANMKSWAMRQRCILKNLLLQGFASTAQLSAVSGL